MALIRCGASGNGLISTATLLQSYTLAANATISSLDIDVANNKTYAFAVHNYQSDTHKPIMAIISGGELIMGDPNTFAISDGKLSGGSYSSQVMYVDWFELS